MNWNSLSRLGAVALTSLSFLAPASQAQGLQGIEIASGLSAPLYVCSPPGDTARLFVLEQTTARIKIIKNGVVLGTPFLDIGAIASGGGERGLLGLAFHPDYFSVGAMGEGKFYVNYTNNGGTTVVREYSVSANADVADAGTFANIMTLAQPFSNHNGGCIQFGADGMLYVGTGDGGSANDPGNRAQNPTNNLGKMLRYDVDLPFPHIPASNPFVGVPGTNDEIWALGIRNPWRFSFDRLTGDMWMGDVGQNAREEINFEAAGIAGGLNYGWRCMEGLNCTGLSGCTCNSIALTLPVDQYSHAGGNCSITGGYRYRGTDMPNYVGKYFYADYCSDRIWSIDFDGTSISNKVEHEADIALPGGVSITSFGEDANGEMYIVDSNGGQIYRLAEDCNPTVIDYCVGAPNSVGAGADLSFSGNADLSDNNAALVATLCPTNKPGMFFYSQSSQMVPLGDGTLCLAGSITRLQPADFTDAFGISIRNLDFTAPPMNSGPGQIVAGTSYFMQYWYRDPAAGGAGSNLTDAVEVIFCP
jgi:glucose/arabinose dehydrogenase